jgi:hypothetical protein
MERKQTCERHIQTTTPHLAARWFAPLWSEEEFGYNRGIRRAETRCSSRPWRRLPFASARLLLQVPLAPGVLVVISRRIREWTADRRASEYFCVEIIE